MRSVKAMLAAGALAALLVPPVALGRGSSGGGTLIAFETPGGARQLHQVYSGLEIKGTVSVDFRGDAAAGCAAAHLCDVRGSVRWDPSGPASVAAIGYRKHGQRLEEGFLTLGFSDNAQSRFPTSARVRREGVPGSLCADAAEDPFGEAHSGPRRGTAIDLRLLDLPSSTTAAGMAFQTRCAGPTTADLAGLLPGYRITERALVRGRRTLDFSADRTFATHGLAGTLHSTVTVRLLGGSSIPGLTSPGGFPPTKKRRVREVQAEYRVERVSGSVVTAVRGRGDPDLCAPLDACGISGSVSIDPSASSGSAYAIATAPARLTGRQLRRALGLARGARPRGIRVYGEASWARDLGSVTADLTRLGAPACLDSLPIDGGGSLFLGYGRRRVRVSYSGGSLFDEADLLRTHCPGPTGGDVGGDLASASVPLRAFRQRRVTLHLTHGRGFRSSAYSGRSRPDVTIVLRRTRVKERTYDEHVPTFDENGHVHSLR
jgi:hypothetical protein